MAFLACVPTISSGLAMDLSRAREKMQSGGDQISAIGEGKSGVGVGVSVGYGVAQGKMQDLFLFPGFTGVSRIQRQHGQFVCGFILDYQKALSKGWFLGGALDLDAGFQELKKETPIVGFGNTIELLTLKRKGAVAPLFVVSKQVGSKWVLSVQAGLSFGLFQVSSTIISQTQVASDRMKKFQKGFVAGAKIAYQFSPKILSFLGAEYTVYKKITGQYKNSFVINAGVPVDAQFHKVTATYALVTPKIGVVYRF